MDFKTREKAHDLFDYLAQELGFEYVSDLNRLKDLCAIKPVIESVRPEEYTLHQWNDLIRYLTGNAGEFASQTEAKIYLLNCVDKQAGSVQEHRGSNLEIGGTK